MRIGYGRYMQNTLDVERTSARGPARTPEISDARIYDEELELASLAEDLGFDSIWTTSHYFTPYQMTGSALQQATFVAGRTERVGFGTMVIVLPWHHPLHVATEIAVLDNMLAGRPLLIGLGRGVFPGEFEVLGIPIEQSAARFLEAAAIIRLALTEEWFSFDGTFYRIPRTSIRPRPRNAAALLDDMRVVWSGGDLPLGAELGLDVLSFAPREIRRYRDGIDRLNEFRTGHGWPASRPVFAMFSTCAESDADGRRRMDRHLDEFQRSGEQLLGNQPLTQRLKRAAHQFLENRGIVDSFAGAQLWGSPAQCLARLEELHRAFDPREVVVSFRFGNMPRNDAEQSMRLFAREVLPVVRSWP
jgi:alkanesulfonate monooxygenase SsuD/methylene tetrahydromethanopterin reductase-like flavin-dependent oxidoreductase (luciferase family)